MSRKPIDLAPVQLREARESDHARIVAVIDDWWGGRRVRHLLPRLWLRHFAGASLIAESEDGTLAGFLVGFVQGERGVVVLAAVDPNRRRRGIGRVLVERFAANARTGGAELVEATLRPDERPAVAFARAVGFVPVERDGETVGKPLWGVPAFEEWDGPGEDRALLVLSLDRPDRPARDG